MCSFNQEYQFINPSTQVALFSVSEDPCLLPCIIEWTTYTGSLSPISGDVIWNVFIAPNLSDSIHFYGKNDFFLTVSILRFDCPF